MLSLAELVKEVLIAQSGMVSFHRTIFNYSLGDLDGLHDHIIPEMFHGNKSLLLLFSNFMIDFSFTFLYKSLLIFIIAYHSTFFVRMN